MRSSGVFGLILIALFLPGIFSQTDFCSDEENATYDPHCCNCSTANYTITKTCNPGYWIDGDPNTQNSSSILNACVGDNWQETPCVECLSGTFGETCKGNCQCESITNCACNNVDGCTIITNGSTSVNCSQTQLKLEMDKEQYSASKGIDSTVTFKATVGIIHEDVTVNVTWMVNEENREESMKYNVDSGFFEYNASIMEMNIGITPYTFTAISKNYSDINDKTISNLTLYDRVVISQVKWSPNKVVSVTENEKGNSWTCNATGYTRPTVCWTYGGGNQVETFSTGSGNRTYQVQSYGNSTAGSTLYIRPEFGIQKKDSGTYLCLAVNENEKSEFRQSVQLMIDVRDPGYEEPTYADRTDFLIGICLVGIALFILIVVFIIYVVWTKRQQPSYKGENEIPNKKKSRGNDYTGAENHPMSPRQDQVEQLQHTTNSLPPQIAPIIRPGNLPPLRYATVKPTISQQCNNESFVEDYGDTYTEESPFKQNALPNLNRTAPKNLSSPNQAKPPPPPRNPSQSQIVDDEIYSEPAETYDALVDSDTYQDVG